MLPSIPSLSSTSLLGDVVVHRRCGTGWALLAVGVVLGLLAWWHSDTPPALAGVLASSLAGVVLALQARLPRRVTVYLATGRVLVEGGRWFQQRRRMLEPRQFDTVVSYSELDSDGPGEGQQVVALLGAGLPLQQLVIATYAPSYRRGEALEHPDAGSLRRHLVRSGFFRDGGFQADVQPYPAAKLF